MSTSMPPRALEALLRALVGQGAGADSVVGDLREEHAALRARSSRARAGAWYAGQVVLVGSWALAGRMNQGWRDVRMGGSVWQDLRHGVRSLVGSPLFTTVSVLTLAIGIGATTAIFSVVHGVLLAPLPFAEPDRLVDIGNNTGGPGWYGSSPAQFIDYEEQLEQIADVGGYTTGLATVGDSLQPRRVPAGFLTHGVWETLKVQPLLGRVFNEDEDVPNGPAVVVLSEGFWRQEYGGDPDIVGQTMLTPGGGVEVVGVMPESFRFPNARPLLWFPFRLDRETPARGNHFVDVVARLEDGRSIEQARAELAALAARSVEAYPENYSQRGYRTRMIPLRDQIVGDAELAILVAFGAVLLVLIIASVNVANLVLSRGVSRRREMAIRAALGAGRARVARQLLTENLLLAAVGGLLGVGIARVAVAGLVATAPTGTPRVENVGVSGPVLAFAVLLVGVTAVIFGLWPALRATRGDLRGSLTHGDRRAVGAAGRRSLRRGLVIAQVALAAVVSVTAGVMIRSLNNLYSEDLGFSGEGVMTFRVDLPGNRYPDPENRIDFYERFTRALATSPGVRGAAASARLPLFNTNSQLSIHIDGKPDTELGAADDAFIQVSTPTYFDVMGIRPSQGRLFTDLDDADAPLVTVVNETMAQQLFADGEALGGRVRMWSEGYPYMEVVGVIPDVKEVRITGERVARMYLPHAQTARSTYSTPGGLYVSVLTDMANPSDVMPTARLVLSGIEPTAVVSRAASMESIVSASLAAEHFVRALLQVFGAIAVLLACVGVYGVLAVSVNERVPEIGLRKALGASSAELLRSVLGESVPIIALGGVVGIVLGVLATGAMESLLFGVSGSDPITLVAVLLVIASTALLAAVMPARRASRVDPMVALKRE